MNKPLLLVGLLLVVAAYGQPKFPTAPLQATLVTSDVENFWIAFDSLELTKGNPLKPTSEREQRLAGIYSSPHHQCGGTLQKVLEKKEAYLKSRSVLLNVSAKEK